MRTLTTVFALLALSMATAACKKSVPREPTGNTTEAAAGNNSTDHGNTDHGNTDH